MPIIRPLSDLRDNYEDISRIVYQSGEPVFFTKDGYVDPIRKRFSHQKVFSDIRHRLRKK
ncbi:MAG TPA: hypothetical protein DDZ89_20275 [Clostridiales bacterium]|nr:hypothetical protein [Clostridiales bacterium]